MHAFSGKSIQKDRKRSHESLSLSGCHFRNLSLMEHDTSDKLHVIMHHIPGNLIASGHPVVIPKGIVPVNAHKILGRAEVTVKLRSLYPYHRILLETPCR